MRTNPALQVAVNELYCCLDILLGNSAAFKVFENSAGDALIRQTASFQAQFIQAMPAPLPVLPSRPLSAAAIRVVDSVLRARVPESAIRRD
jgi:hypothetical protein